MQLQLNRRSSASPAENTLIRATRRQLRIITSVAGLTLLIGGCGTQSAPEPKTASPRTISPHNIVPQTTPPQPAAAASPGLQEPSPEAKQPAFPGGALVDLTHAFDQNTIFWPTDNQGFRFERGPFGITERGYFYSANRFAMAEHGGTHLDAPIHFAEDHPTADKVPLANLIGPAVLVDVSQQCRENPDYLISVADLRDWEERHDRTLAETIVLLRTGYYAHWPNRVEYLGTPATGDEAIPNMHFPGLDPDAARWLTEHRFIRAVGIDTASIDYGQSRKFESHVALCKHNVPIFENVANLGDVPETGFNIIALPMKIAGGSGGPLRIVAVLPQE